MARPREFDLDQAREDAMNVFWDLDFHGASLPDLLDGLGLSRGSLYKAFGNKRALFIEALDLYDRQVLQPGIAMLSDPTNGSGDERIASFFHGALELVEQGDRRGCLLCNAAVGATRDDPEVGQIVSRMLDDLSGGFVNALEDIPRFTGTKADELKRVGDAITMAYVGQRVMARSGADINKLKDASMAALSIARP